MPQPMRSRVNDFIADVCRLVSRLDVVSRRDKAELLEATLQSTSDTYQELLQRLKALELSAEDAEMVQGMLERIKARLRFLTSK